MKKLITLILFSASFSSFSQAGAKIEFLAADNTIDYGTISKDTDSGLRTFEFRNTGDAPLIITDVRSTCGCTVPTKPKDPVLPGKTGKIDVRYNMTPGPIRKTITVESNAVNYPDGKVPLKIKGEVIDKAEPNLMEKKKSPIQR